MTTLQLQATDDGRSPGNFIATDAAQRALDRTYARRDQIVTPETLPAVICGDSHAEYSGDALANAAALWGRTVLRDGIAGQQSGDISARLGGVPARVTVDGGFIPESGPVVVTFADGVRPLRNGGSGTVSREAVLVGFHGALSTSDGGVTYQFTRTTPGQAVPVPAGSPLVMGMGARAGIPILLAPRNDIGKNEAAGIWRAPKQTILDRYKRMADWLAPDGVFLLLDILPWADEDSAGTAARLEMNDALRDQHPQQWLAWSVWLRSDSAFAAVGATKTAQDEADIAAGVTPTSFRRTNDAGHLNTTGYNAAWPFIGPALAAAVKAVA